MRKDERKTSEPKGAYCVRNWAEYNQGLIARGDVAMWIDENVLTQAPDGRVRIEHWNIEQYVVASVRAEPMN